MIALVAFAFTGANAQIVTDAGTFTKPTGGTTIMEVSLTPNVIGGGIFDLPSLNSDLGVVGLKARHFTSENRAYRIGANVSILDSGEDGDDTEFTAALSYGIEHHMKGAERLSTYWGYEANVGFVQSNGNYDDWDNWSGKTTKMGVGAGVFTGFDYYIMPKVYLGAELGYGIAVTSTDPKWGDTVTKVQLAPSITPSMRLGWQF